MNNTPSRFSKTSNPGTAVCSDCGRRTWKSNIDCSTGLCTSQPTTSPILPQVSCYDKAGEENSHTDGYHTDKPSPWCPTCLEDKGFDKMETVMRSLKSTTPATIAAAEEAPHFLACPLCSTRSQDSVANLIAHLATKHL